MQTTFENLGGTYRQEGDYLLPNIKSPESPQVSIWGERRRMYLREHNNALYTGMFLSGKLHGHLEEVDQSAAVMFDRLVEQLRLRDGITEEMKATNPLEWIRRMQIIRHEATEIVIRELICT